MNRRTSRSPHGECGLKYRNGVRPWLFRESLPAWGVWIEICGSPHHFHGRRSLPAWGVWIEIDERDGAPVAADVAPRMGSVD